MERDRLHLPLALALLAAALLAWYRADFFGQEMLAEMFILAIFAMSLDVLVGLTGMVSLGHAAFLAVGAYTTAAATVFLGLPVSLATAIALAVSAALAAVVGLLVVRLGGIFFIMITLAIGQMVYAYFFKARAFGADDGMSGTPRLDLAPIGADADDPAVFALLTLAVAAAVYLGLRWLSRSAFGVMLLAIHQNEHRLRSLGCPVARYKLAAFVLAGTVAGLAGSLTAQHTGFVSPDLAFWTVSGEVLIVVIVGGMGSLLGPAGGAALIVWLRHTLSDAATWEGLGLPAGMAEYWQMVMGLFFIAVVLLAADGVYGRLRWAAGRLGRRRAEDPGGHRVQG